MTTLSCYLGCGEVREQIERKMSEWRGGEGAERKEKGRFYRVQGCSGM